MGDNFLAVVQARTSSSRLPGKVLKPILGVPMIGRQLERLARVTSLDRLVVATSSDPSDDALAHYVDELGIPVVRGSLNDVLGRFVKTIDAYPCEAVVRLTADCPLTSPTVVDQVIEAFATGDADYVSNTLEPTYPDGVDVEVVKASALRWVDAASDDVHEREHVTLGVYRRPERFSLVNVSGKRDLSDLRWTVDSEDDLAFARTIYERLYAKCPAFDIDDVVALLDREPSLSRTCESAARNAALKGIDTGAMRHS